MFFFILKAFYWKRCRRDTPGKPKWQQISPYFFQTAIYLIVGTLFFICAFKKFNINITEWRASAAESRTLNVPCSEFWSHFYDEHDVWHFFSAVALFFFFMVRRCRLTWNGNALLTRPINIPGDIDDWWRKYSRRSKKHKDFLNPGTTLSCLKGFKS